MARFWTVLIIAAGWASLCAAATAPSLPATAPATIVSPQERLSFKLDDSGAPIVLDRQPAQGGPDMAAPIDFSKEQFGAVRMKALSAAPNTIVATLWSDKGVTMLKVENGFDHPVAYTAMLVFRRGSETVMRNTTVCPLRAHGGSFENWPGRVDGVALVNFKALPPGDLKCEGDTQTAAMPASTPPAPAASVNVCSAGNPIAGPPPVGVRLTVSPADGAIQSRAATWAVASMAGGPAPTVLLDYTLDGSGGVAAAPNYLSIFEAKAMKPLPPSPTASIVVLVDGVEQTRRPWGLYAQAMAAIGRGDKVPELFAGVVPFNSTGPSGQPDAGLAQLLAGIGSGQVKTLEVRVVGERGGIMDRHLFQLMASPLRDPAVLAPLLREAEAKAAAPDHCARPAVAAR